MRLYLDTAPVIYTVENVPIYSQAVDKRLALPEIERVASDLTRMECRNRSYSAILRTLSLPVCAPISLPPKEILKYNDLISI